MMFFINNPIALIISVVIVTFITIMTVKIVREVKLNSLLKGKQGFMRVATFKPQVGFKRRMGVLTSTALSPIAIVAIVVLVGNSSTATNSGEFLTLETSDDVYNVYSEVANIVNSTRESGLDDFEFDLTPSNDVAGDEGIDNDTVDYLYDALGKSAVGGDITGFDELLQSVYNDNSFYEVNGSAIEISANSGDSFEGESGQFVDSILYSGSTASCTKGYLIKGLFLDDDILVAVSLEYPVSCLGEEVDEDFILENMNVLVSIIDLEDISNITNYRLSGTLSGVVFEDGSLYVATKRYLDYESIGFDINKYNPYYSIDGSKTYMEYKDVKYVEGVIPNSYLSVFGINLDSKSVDMNVVLGDFNSDLIITNSTFEIVSEVLYFVEFAGMFELEQPVDELKIVTLTFALDDGDIVYLDSEIK